MGASLWLDEILYYHYERYPEIRAIELGRPGSFWPRFVGPYAYADLQRGIHAAFAALGFQLSTSPELYLRLTSTVSFAGCVIALYWIARLAGATRLWAGGVALAFGSTPAFLFYAFEARVYSFAALIVIAFAAVLSKILEDGSNPHVWILTIGSVLGLCVTWAHLWNVCLLAGIGACVPIIIWRDPQGWRKGMNVALLIAAGLMFTVVQKAYVSSLAVPGQRGIILFDPQPLKPLFRSTVYGPFLGLVRGHPEYVLGILLAIALFRGSGRLGWCLPTSVWLGLALSIFLMHKYGMGISPRHQTPLYAGVFACFALTRAGLVSKALLANLITMNLVLLPGTVGRIERKANSKQIASVIETGQRLRRFPVVVQHSYTLGYPDPLHSFGLALYLNGIRPRKIGTAILELPTHRDVRDVLLDREYFMNGPEKLEIFAATPVDHWIAFLKGRPDPALWLVAPAGPRNEIQRRKYESALAAAGFSRVRGITEEFDGYPRTTLTLWRKEGPTQPAAALRDRAVR